MARDDRLKKVSGAGADFLETARAKAEEFLREMAKASGDTTGRAQGALDELVEGGRKGTDQFVASGKYADDWTASDRNAMATNGSEQADLGIVEIYTCVEDNRALGDVLPGLSNTRAGSDRRRQPNGLPRILDILKRGDTVCPRRERAAGHNASRVSCTE